MMVFSMQYAQVSYGNLLKRQTLFRSLVAGSMQICTTCVVFSQLLVHFERSLTEMLMVVIKIKVIHIF